MVSDVRGPLPITRRTACTKVATSVVVSCSSEVKVVPRSPTSGGTSNGRG